MKTYDQVHGGLLWFRGKASEYPCVGCGESAAEWAYRNTGSERELTSASGAVYSEDIWNDYDPMCKPCHKKRDRHVLVENGRKSAERLNERFREDPDFAERIRTVRQGAARKGHATQRARFANDPEYARRIRENARLKGMKAARTMRRCSCGRTMAAGPLGTHQRYTGHEGWENA